MSVLQFRCTLLSDVILNQKAATEGPNTTLDFIPGSNFLGIVANRYIQYAEAGNAMEVFHSGRVRFGDAHPSQSGFRGLKVPASMFHPKLKNAGEDLYIHHRIPNLADKKLKEKQLKQCRSGYYDFSDAEKAFLIKTETNFAIKSAYDKDARHSKDEQMYGYQSLQKGLILYFEVEVLDDSLTASIKEALMGTKRIGRSRTAQYGLIDIEECAFTEVKSQKTTGQYVEVYADGRLIFLDENGMPTYQPTAEQLGLQGTICWEKSQVRTFQYAPWNYKRQCFDTDRCGIEKGSVIVVKTDHCPEDSQYVGNYKNEGFGKVIYNPAFLKADENGRACVSLYEKPAPTDMKGTKLSGTLLLDYLAKQQHQEAVESETYRLVNNWVKVNAKWFRGNTFASQWGSIRSIAMQHKTKQELLHELFDKKRLKNGEEADDGYLSHGVAAEKWAEKGRRSKLESFIKYELTDENAQIAIINLAAEMAKKCKEDR
jgi:hypothetical protein